MVDVYSIFILFIRAYNLFTFSVNNEIDEIYFILRQVLYLSKFRISVFHIPEMFLGIIQIIKELPAKKHWIKYLSLLVSFNLFNTDRESSQ